MRLISFLTAIVLIASCGRQDNDVFKNVELPGAVIAHSYNKATIDSVIAKIDALPELVEDLKTAKLTTVTNDSIVLDGIVERAGDGRIPFEKGFDPESFIFVVSNQNASRTWENNKNEYGYSLVWLDSTDLHPPSQEGFRLWSYHTGGYQHPNRYDSIDRQRVEKLEKELKREKAVLKKAKYLVSLCDITLIKPKLVDKETFEGGIIISEVKVYDIKTNQKIGSTVIVETNSDTVKNFVSAVGTEMKEEVLYGNLLARRNGEIIRFLKNNEKQDESQVPE